jgi:hypothetical protein
MEANGESKRKPVPGAIRGLDKKPKIQATQRGERPEKHGQCRYRMLFCENFRYQKIL